MRRGKVTAWIALVALAAWLLSPMLHPVHVEGFSASIVALGIHLTQGTLSEFFPSQPFATEYFGLTKLGAVLGVAGLVKLGLSGESAMTALMLGGAILLFGGSARLARRWSGAPWLVVAIVLLLIPGAAESGFFLNDNMPGSGLLVAALALFCGARGRVAPLMTGVMIGLAVAIRTDLVLVTPALFLMAWDGRRLRDAASLTALVGIVALATVWLIYAAVGVSPLAAVHAGARAVDLWHRPIDVLRQVRVLVLFAGLPVLIVCVPGVRAEIAGRDWRRIALLLGIPVLMNLALAGKIWEVRQLLPMTPFLAALAARGAGRLVATWSRGHRRGPTAIAIAILALLVAPPAIAYRYDGPRVLIGRIGSVADWRAWQARIRRNFAMIDRAIAAPVASQRLAIVTDYWDEDRYVHLLLLEQGFRPTKQPRACDAIGQTMAKGGRTVLQISPHQTFLPDADALFAPKLAQLAIPCLTALPSPAILVASADQIGGLARPNRSALAIVHASDTRLSAQAASPALLAALGRAHTREAVPVSFDERRTLPEADRALRAETAFGRDR